MRRFAAIGILMLSIGLSPPAAAEGAIAVGIAAKGAYSSGYSKNESSVDVARANALAGCKKSYPAPGNDKDFEKLIKTARDNCKVVATFHDQCAAGALDPKPGEIGAGWGVGKTQKDADEQAINRCRNTAGSGRAEFCKVFDRHCDGSAH